MADERISLTDDQREEIRVLLSKFGTKQAEKKSDAPKIKAGPDPFKNAPPGKTIEIFECTPSTRKYQLVRDSKAAFLPLILDGIECTRDEVVHLVDRLGLHRKESDGLVIISSVTQADPIRIMHVQLEQVDGRLYKVASVRYIT